MRVCPKCGDYYADAPVAFCLADGTPLTELDKSSEKWSEGSRTIAEKAKGLRTLRRTLKWRRLALAAAAILITAFVLSRSFSVETTKAAVYNINGRVTDAGEPISGVNIALGGAKTATTTTDENGNYSFTGLPAGSNYTITAVPKLEMVFTEPSISIASLKQDATADFHVQPLLYTISGQVTDVAEPINGVKITLDGAKTAATTTDENGNYSFTGLPAGGSYAITAVPKVQMVFTEPSISIASLKQNATADFHVQPVLYKISGQVRDRTNGIGEVKILLSGAKADSKTTDAKGNYSFTGLPAGGSYTITAVPRLQMIFTKPSLSVASLKQDARADFHVKPVLYKIIVRVAGAAGPPGRVNLQIKGAKNYSTTTDARGNYTFTDLPAGSAYLIAPVSEKLDFTPPQWSIGKLTQNESAVFTGVPKVTTCTEADKRLEIRIIDDIWRRKISAGDFLNLNPPGVVGTPDSIRIERITVFENCTVAEVIISYPSRVVENPDARQRRMVRAERRFGCNKTKGTWTCP